MVTLLTVLRSGGRYDASWVERLAAGARRSIAGLERIVCLTDLALDVEGVETVPLLHNWPSWWSKFEAFRPDLAGIAPIHAISERCLICLHASDGGLST